MKDIKLIVTDMDGTLLNANKQISDYSQHILKQAQQQGIGVVLATGRGMKHMGEYIPLLEMNRQPLSGFITLNGIELYNHQKECLVCHEKLTNKDVLPFYEAIKNENVTLIIFYSQSTVQITNNYIDEKNFLMMDDLELSSINEIDRYADQELIKIAICGEYANDIVQKLSLDIKNSYDICRVEDTWIEINPYGITKGKGLLDYLSYHHLNINQAVVFGNGENDISMLEIVEHSVATSNAMESVNKVCHYQCGHHDKDGVAHFIEEYILKK